MAVSIATISEQNIIIGTTDYRLEVATTDVTDAMEIVARGDWEGFYHTWDQSTGIITINNDDADQLKTGKTWVLDVVESGSVIESRTINYNIVKIAPVIDIISSPILIYKNVAFSELIPVANSPDTALIRAPLVGMKTTVELDGVLVEGLLPVDANLDISSFNAPLTVANLGGSHSRDIPFEIVTGVAAVISTIANRVWPQGIAQSFTFNVTGTPTPVVTVSGLPEEITLEHVSGTQYRISGTPSTGGTITFTVTATGFGDEDTDTSTISVETPVVPVIAAVPNLLAVIEATSLNETIYTARATGLPTPTFTATGLPSGVGISSGGTIRRTGTLSEAISTATITAVNSQGSDTEDSLIIVENRSLYVVQAVSGNYALKVYEESRRTGTGTSSRTISFNRTFPGSFGRGIAIHPTNREVYVGESNEMFVYDLKVGNGSNMPLLRTVNLHSSNDNSEDIVLDFDNNWFWVYDRIDERFLAYDINSGDGTTPTLRRWFNLNTSLNPGIIGAITGIEYDNGEIYVTFYKSGTNNYKVGVLSIPSNSGGTITFNRVFELHSNHQEFLGCEIWGNNLYIGENDTGSTDKIWIYNKNATDGSTATYLGNWNLESFGQLIGSFAILPE